jgi:SAM-dependent MidA family methyltransferase
MSPALPIRRELSHRMHAAGGAIPWCEFMDGALYQKDVGYYARPRAIGRSGDFYTSVSTGPVFGRLLAGYVGRKLRALGLPSAGVLECGAADGKLAEDIRHHLPGVAYRTQEHGQPWPEPFDGVILSNELLDALPCHRVVAREGEWREWFVTAGADDGFAWTVGPLSDPRLAERLSGLPVAALEGCTTEINLNALDWLAAANRTLRSGWIVTIDYGPEPGGFLTPHRPEGSLRAYRNHRLVPDLLADPGEQDLTADVDFGAFMAEGERLGLRTEMILEQGRFLTRECEPEILALADAPTAERRQLQTLLHPAFLGRAFRVLVQRKVVKA